MSDTNGNSEKDFFDLGKRLRIGPGRPGISRIKREYPLWTRNYFGQHDMSVLPLGLRRDPKRRLLYCGEQTSPRADTMSIRAQEQAYSNASKRTCYRP